MFLTAAMLPAAVSSREVANQIKCATNLRQIGQAFQLYANENNGNFPRTKYDHAATKVNALSPASPPPIPSPRMPAPRPMT